MELVRRGNDGKYLFYCHGCRCHHFWDERWTWDGNADAPSVTPSILVPGKCHLWVEGGKLVYLADCAHALANKTVRMTPIEE